MFWLALQFAGTALADTHRELAGRIAAEADLQMLDIQSGAFLIRTWSRISRPGLGVSVYIEGDGRAWASRTERSTDPTPRNPLGLRFAAWDRGPNVAYVARPCQYVPMHRNPACDDLLWTDRRFSEPVLESLDGVLDHLRGRVADGIHIAGFSGGGAVAALLAARRLDIISLRTFAGNLDHEAVNHHHGVSPMSGSLNPIHHTGALAQLPQAHYSGALDEVVPPFIARRFLAALPTPGCARHVTLPDTTHHRGWSAHRAELSAVPEPAHAGCRRTPRYRWRQVPAPPLATTPGGAGGH